MNIALLLALAMLVYAFFGIFTSLAGGKIPATLSSAILNGLGAALPLIVWQIQRMGRGEQIPTTPLGLLFSALAGLTVAAFSILLVTMYGRGGELSFVFPVVYGGAIALTALAGWLALGDTFSWTHLAGVTTIVIGIGLLAVPVK